MTEPKKSPHQNKREISNPSESEIPNSDIKRIFESDGNKKNPPDPTGNERRTADPDA